MDSNAVTSAISSWISANALQLIVTLAVAVTYIALDRFSSPRIAVEAQNSRLKVGAANKAIHVARLITAVFGGAILILVWGIDLGPLLVFSTTVITLLGVALFASWSLLSNVTAYFILLLHPSFRRGNYLRVLDADNYVEGYISELNLFNTKLITERRSVIVYPNNLLLGRPALINPRDRLEEVGKLGQPGDEGSAGAVHFWYHGRRRK